MNRRDSFKAAVAGFLGTLWPWGAKAEDRVTQEWIATIKYLPSNATFSIGSAESKET